jgi:hypothetical protein
VVWACHGLEVRRVGVLVSVAVMFAFSFVGTRDSLEFHSAVWSADRYARSLGVTTAQLDGGAGWTRYQLADGGRKVAPFPGAYAPWWVTADHRTTAQYVVASDRLPGFELVRVFHYSQWLQSGSSTIYLQKRPAPRP